MIQKLNNKVNIKQQDISSVFGVWEYNFGSLVLNQDGSKVTGYYDWEDGMITGEIKNNIFYAVWKDQPTYSPPEDTGRCIAKVYNNNKFNGSWGYDNKDLYYNVTGIKKSSIFIGNCYRYHIKNNLINVPFIRFNDIRILCNETTSYIYPENCSLNNQLRLSINKKIIIKKIKFKPGFSYLISLEGDSSNIIVNTIIENPFM